MTELKVCFFPHSENMFKDERHLRDWLDSYLRKYLRGKYRLKKAQGLGALEAGSIVFFHFKGWVVGYAVVKKAKRPITKEERGLFGSEWEHVVEFEPDSIWTWGNEQFLPIKTVEEIIGKGIGRGFATVDELPCLLKILEKSVRGLLR